MVNKKTIQNAFLKLLKVAAVAANEAEGIKDAFLPILKEICCYTGWEIGHAYVISKDDPNLLEPTEVWCIEEQKQFMDFCSVTKKTGFTRGVGLPGRVLASRKPHWIVDVTKDKNFLRAQIALDLNIKSGIAFPVMVGHSVVAVLEFFTTKTVNPDQQLMEIMADLGILLGRVIERKKAEEELKILNKTLEQKIVERTGALAKTNEELRAKIVQHTEAKDLLQKNKEQLQSILDNTTAVIYVKDKNGKYILVNRQFETLFHVSCENIIGKTDMDIFPEEMAEAFRANDLKVLNAGRPLELEELAPHDDGPHTYISIKFPIFNLSGIPDRVCGISTDITERKLMEEQLRKLSCVVEQNPITVVITDTKGSIEYVNPKFTQLTGYTLDEAIGKNPGILKSGKTPPEIYKQLWKVITSGGEWQGDFCNRKKNGELYWESASISPIRNTEGRITHFVAIKEDITERKCAEDKEAAYQTQLKRLSSALSLTEERERRHISEDLHDRIGQSLTVIKMKLEEMQEPQTDTDTGRVLNETWELLDKTIKDLRTLTFEISPPILYELGFEQAVEWLVEQFRGQHNISIDFVSNGLDIKLNEDISFFLFKAVRELLFNIVKHARANRIKVLALKKNNKIQINIEDDGVGFNTSKVKFSVNELKGFGLFSIRERMEHFGGNLDIKSKSGRGTRITLVMPLMQQKGDAGAEQ